MDFEAIRWIKNLNQTEEELTRAHLSQELAIQMGSLAKEYILVHKWRMDEK